MEKDYSNYYACDFETYVPEDDIPNEIDVETLQTYVWSACGVCLTGDHKPWIRSNMQELFHSIAVDTLSKKHKTATCYFHNLKFDGTFILQWLLNNGCKFIHHNDKTADGRSWLNINLMNTKEFSAIISSMGAYYKIVFKRWGVTFNIIDSLKLLPFSLDKACKSFKTEHQKTSMNYKGVKSVDSLTDKDREYIENDVYCLRECLNIMFNEGLTKMTIGGCCMEQYKQSCINEYDRRFPDLYDIELPPESDSRNADEYIRRSYRGGWCYCNERIQGQQLENGEVYDANSLYPSVMLFNEYPVGEPFYIDLRKPYSETWKRRMKDSSRFYYFIRFKCKFKLKPGHYPFIQIKGNPCYKGNEMLKSSEIVVHGQKYNSFRVGNKTFNSIVELTLTKTDWILFKESYYINELQLLDMVMFDTEKDIYTDYITKWRDIKIQSDKDPVKRQVAKLMLNNCYGKTAQSNDSSYKVPYIDDHGILNYYTIEEHNKRGGYIACGSAITSYARNETIRKANANYDNFAYADTDSLHLYDFKGKEPKDVYIHDTAFGGWKNETSWLRGVFLRQKTYMEYTTAEDREPCKPFYKICCAGMTKSARDEFLTKLNNLQLSMDDFKIGLTLTQNLKPVQVKGGTLLLNREFKIR